MSEWNAEQYLKFKNERTQPCIDLVSRIKDCEPRRIIDIGCGPGNSSAVLKNAFPNSYVLGIDSSDNMITKAENDHSDIDFKIFDASGSLDELGKFDIVFSNACLQWVPDQRKIIGNMYNALNFKGMGAVQIPIQYEQPIHKIIADIAQSEKWSEKLKSCKRVFYTLSQEEYYDILSELTDDFSMWTVTYFHRMKSHDDIIEWYKGTGLRPYLQALDENDAAEFEKEVLKEVKKSYPVQANGDVIFRFPRLFMTFKKSE